MAVSSVIVSSAGTGTSTTGTDINNAASRHRAYFRATCDSQSDTSDIVEDYFRRTFTLPYIGRRFKIANGSDTKALCTSINVTTVEKGAGRFLVECGFEPESLPQREAKSTSSGKQSENPLLWHDEIDVSSITIAEPVEQAIFRGFLPGGINNPDMPAGKLMPVQNSALKPFDPGIDEEVHITVIRITKYARSFNELLASRYRNKVNSDFVTILKGDYRFIAQFNPYQGKIAGFSAVFAVANGIPHWRQTIEVHVHPRSWRRILIDQGIEELLKPGDIDEDGNSLSNSDFPSGRGFEWKHPKDTDGYPQTQPVPFDGKGKMKGPTDPHVWLVYSTKEEIPFAGIPW
jgi:hypothetical protein